MLCHSVAAWCILSAGRILRYSCLLLIQTFVWQCWDLFGRRRSPCRCITVFVLFVFFYRPSRRRGKSLPTGFATTYRGAYASEHATETMRKAVYLTPCEIPGEIAPKKRKKYARCFFFFSIIVIFIFIPAVVTDRFAPVMRQEDGLLGGLWRSLVSLVQSHITTSPTFR